VEQLVLVAGAHVKLTRSHQASVEEELEGESCRRFGRAKDESARAHSQ
jgi:hypothetical protein